MKISAAWRLQAMLKCQTINDGTRTLLESALAPDIIQALKDLAKTGIKGVIIGGLAFSYYAKPRMTQDIDVLFLSDNDIPEDLSGFRQSRKHAKIHEKTHVEIELLSPEFLHISPMLVKKVFETATEQDGLLVASKEGLILLKMERWSIQDKADAVALLKTGTDFSRWHLSSIQKAKLEEAQDLLAKEKPDLRD